MLLSALELCKKRRATLLIAKLDRLARNVFFISGLLESGVDFVAVDQLTKDKFMLHVQAAFAEEEARRISIRTKEALAAAKRSADRAMIITAASAGIGICFTHGLKRTSWNNNATPAVTGRRK